MPSTCYIICQADGKKEIIYADWELRLCILKSVVLRLPDNCNKSWEMNRFNICLRIDRDGEKVVTNHSEPDWVFKNWPLYNKRKPHNKDLHLNKTIRNHLFNYSHVDLYKTDTFDTGHRFFCYYVLTIWHLFSFTDIF